MADTTIAVSVALPDALSDEMKRRMRALQFHDVGVYVRWLIAKDVDPESDDADLMNNLLLEGLASGPGRVLDESYLREIRERTDKIIADKANQAESLAG